MPEDRPDPALLYLRQYGTRYNLDALRQQMAIAGHSEPAIEAAIAAWQAESAGREPAWRLGLQIFIGNLVLAGAWVALLLNTSGRTGAAIGVALPLALGIEAIGGLILLFFPRHRRLGRALLLGFGSFLGLVILPLGAFCLYEISQSGF